MSVLLQFSHSGFNAQFRSCCLLCVKWGKRISYKRIPVFCVCVFLSPLRKTVVNDCIQVTSLTPWAFSNAYYSSNKLSPSALCLIIVQDHGVSCHYGWQILAFCIATNCQELSQDSLEYVGSSRTMLIYSVLWSRYGLLLNEIGY